MPEALEPVPPGVPRLDFVVPGFGKCGTTTFCALLAAHPEVFIPEAKELWFFNRPDYREDWDYLRRAFRDARPGHRLGDASAGAYLSLGEGAATAAALARHFPDCRILILARDPVERLVSSYREMHHSAHLYGLECPFSLDEALDVLPMLLDDSLYWQCSEPYRRLFPPEQIRVLFFEDMRRDAAGVLREACRHIGVDPGALPLPVGDVRLNAGESKLADTRLLRLLKRQPTVAAWLRTMAEERRERLLAAVGLRRPLGRVERSPELLARVRERLGDDARRFLRHYGKPEDFWPGVAGLASTPPRP